MAKRRKIEYENDVTENVSHMIEHRFPWLALGLFGGIIATIISSQFEEVLSKNIHIAFFIPVIVYMADAVGHQTESVYVRNLGKKNVRFGTYVFKEFFLGLAVGSLFGISTGCLSYLWYRSFETSLTIGTAMFVTMSIAPVIALIVPTIIQKEHRDPAVGSGPFTTVIQDVLSLTIYLMIASVLILK